MVAINPTRLKLQISNEYRKDFYRVISMELLEISTVLQSVYLYDL